jgi:hypothetical protein
MKNNRLFFLTGSLVLLVGLFLYSLFPLALLDIIRLPATSLLSHYALASFGSVAICWSMLLLAAQHNIERQVQLALPSACGFALLALMRLMTLPQADTVLTILPANIAALVAGIEVLSFSLLAAAFFRVHYTINSESIAES